VTAAIDLNKSENYVSGRWGYQYALSNEGSRSEGYYGKLLFDGKPLPEPENINDYFQTPWGAIYWVGEPFVAFGVHGWMPNPVVRAKIGQRLPDPATAVGGGAALVVWVKVLQSEGSPAPDAAPIEKWIAEELGRMEVQRPAVTRDWTPVGADFLTLHDSKHFGRCKVRTIARGDSKTLTVEVIGAPQPTFDLPRQPGATKLIRCRLTGMFGNLDLYLAFKTEAQAPRKSGVDALMPDLNAASAGK